MFDYALYPRRRFQLRPVWSWGEDRSMRTKSCTLALLVLAAMLLRPAFAGQRQEQNTPPTPKSDVRPEDRIDLNHATLAELMKLPGMTHTWAERIIRFRPYRSKQDLVDEGILPGGVYRRIRDYVIAHRDKS